MAADARRIGRQQRDWAATKADWAATKILPVGYLKGLYKSESHDSFFKTARTKGEVPSAFCPFAPVESVLVAKVSIGERRGWPGDDDRAVT